MLTHREISAHLWLRGASLQLKLKGTEMPKSLCWWRGRLGSSPAALCDINSILWQEKTPTIARVALPQMETPFLLPKLLYSWRSNFTCPVPSEPLDTIKELVEYGVYIGCETANLDWQQPHEVQQGECWSSAFRKKQPQAPGHAMGTQLEDALQKRTWGPSEREPPVPLSQRRLTVLLVALGNTESQNY